MDEIVHEEELIKHVIKKNVVYDIQFKHILGLSVHLIKTC